MASARDQSDDELDVQEETEDNEVAVSFDIASYPSDLTLSVVYEMWEDGDIVIPEYQRNFVWSIRQASLLIESFLLGLPVPQVFFYVNEQNKSEVIDGQQRIMSLVYFMDGHFGSESIHGNRQVFRLQGLGEKSPFAKKTFEELSNSHQRKLKGAVLRAINIRQLNPKGEATSVYHIFERLNTGGTPLKPQEIRNCVFRGELVKALRALNTDTHWRKILGKKTLDKHQKDVELVLRVFAMGMFFERYEKPMKEYLNVIMAQEQKASSPQAQSFLQSFPRVAKLIVQKLGEKPFHVRGPLNSAALDAVFCTLVQAGKTIPDDLQRRYADLQEDDVFRETTFYSTSDAAVVKRRFERARRHLLG